MILPQNGRIVVIDDILEEGLPLVKVLAKNGVPTTYFTGKYDELPSEPLQDVRLVFLDIVIGTKQAEKNIISTLQGILKKIIGPQNSPYILIAWTMHNELIEKIRKLPGVCPPHITLNLEKAKCKIDNEKYDLDIIESRIKQELKEIGILHLFVLWENIVHESANRIIKEFTSFYDNDGNWNKNLSDVIFQLARAYIGKQLKKNNKKEIIQNGLLTFNGTFMDTLENAIQEFKPSAMNIKFDAVENITEEVSAKINSRLLLFESLKTNALHPGNIYEIENNSKLTMEIADVYDGKLENFGKKDELINQLKHVSLEVSPTCDFAQRKWRRSRLISGAMWPKDHCSNIKKAEYIYTSPYLAKNGSIFKLVFDLRYFTSLSFNTLKKMRPAFRVKHELLVDIQTHLARHISRPGVTFIEESRKRKKKN
jgi:hypothetical protein